MPPGSTPHFLFIHFLCFAKELFVFLFLFFGFLLRRIQLFEFHALDGNIDGTDRKDRHGLQRLAYAILNIFANFGNINAVICLLYTSTAPFSKDAKIFFSASSCCAFRTSL